MSADTIVARVKKRIKGRLGMSAAVGVVHAKKLPHDDAWEICAQRRLMGVAPVGNHRPTAPARP